MGYYTRYELVVDDCEKHKKEIELLVSDNYLFGDPSTWYEHEKDMREHSLKYPNLLFRLNGQGEESGDIWIEYYKNGKMQKAVAKLMFDKFREELLI